MAGKKRKIAFRSFVLLLVVLFFGFFLLFRSATLQTYLVRKVGSYFSEKTGAQISVGSIELRWFKRFSVQDLLILDHHQDTMLFAHHFNVQIEDYDFKERRFAISDCELKGAYVSVKKYQNEDLYNFRKFLDGIGVKQDKTKKSRPVVLKSNALTLEDVKFKFWDENKEMKKFGVDYHHLIVEGLKGEIDDFEMYHDSINAKINSLSFEEKSGFQLKGLKAYATICSSKTAFSEMSLKASQTELNGKLSFNYEHYADWKRFVNQIKIKAHFAPSRLSGEDLSYFVPALEGLKDTVSLEGKISGKIGKLKLKNFLLSFGKQSYFKGRLDVDGLPDVNNAFMYMNVKELVTNDEDLRGIPLPPFVNGEKLKVPRWVKNLGDVNFKGKYTGFPGDFVAYGKVQTACGQVKSDVQFRKGSEDSFVIKGRINTAYFNLKRLLGKKQFGGLSFGGDVEIKVVKEQFNFGLNGGFPFIELYGYQYHGVKANGTLSDSQFEGDLQVNDTNLLLGFNGGINFSELKQELKFKAEVKRANLTRLGLISRDSSTSVSFNMDIDLMGDKVKNAFGKVDVSDFQWRELGRDYNFTNSTFRSSKVGEQKFISVNSDWLMAKIEGVFDLQDVYPSLISIASKNLPVLADSKYSFPKVKGENNFQVMFKIKDYHLIHDLFTPELWLDQALFSGAFNDQADVLHFNFSADTLKYKGVMTKKLNLHGHNQNERMNLLLRSDFVGLGDSVGVKDFQVGVLSSENINTYDVSWDNHTEITNHGLISGVVGMSILDSVWTHVNQFDVVIEDNLWAIDSTNEVVFEPDKMSFHHLRVRSEEEIFDAEGVLSLKSNNDFTVNAKSFKLSNLERIFKRYHIDLRGLLSGTMKVEGFINQPIIKSDLEVKEFKLNGQTFGRVCLNSDYFSEQGRVVLDLTAENQSKSLKGKVISLSGDYYPSLDGKLSLSAKLTNLKVSFLEPYFKGVFSEFNQGKASSEIYIKGTLKEPEFYGKLRLDQMNLKVDYLNVNYAINGEYIVFDDNKMVFDEFKLTHNKYMKSKVLVNGTIFHEGFKNISYQMDHIKLKDAFCLNTSIDENPSYYGQAFVKGVLQAQGNGKVNSLSGAISTVPYKDKFNKGSTKLNLPLSEAGELETIDFIHFVDLKKEESEQNIRDKKLDLSGLSLNFNFLINEEASAKIIFDPKVGDEIEVKGNGNINMKINSEGNFAMSGKYTISEGQYFFTLKNFIGKKFLVDKGGVIVWDGDPVNASIDVQTQYQARAKLIDLANPSELNYQVNKEKFGSRTAVYAGLEMQGELMKPEIKMGVSLPNGTPEEKEFLYSRLIGEDEINRQVFALLLTNQFLPSSANGLSQAVNVSTGIDNGIQFLQGQLNNSLGGILNNVDLGVDYNSGSQTDSLSNDELRLLLGFQYKNFSVKTDYALNNEAGEIQVEYQLTDQLKAKAYRRTTETVILDNGFNLTQGAGIVYQKSFNSIRGLFRQKKRNHEKQ